MSGTAALRSCRLFVNASDSASGLDMKNPDSLQGAGIVYVLPKTAEGFYTAMMR